MRPVRMRTPRSVFSARWLNTLFHCNELIARIHHLLFTSPPHFSSFFISSQWTLNSCNFNFTLFLTLFLLLSLSARMCDSASTNLASSSSRLHVDQPQHPHVCTFDHSSVAGHSFVSTLSYSTFHFYFWPFFPHILFFVSQLFLWNFFIQLFIYTFKSFLYFFSFLQ